MIITEEIIIKAIKQLEAAIYENCGKYYIGNNAVESVISDAIASVEAEKWLKYPENKPEIGIEVLMHNPVWIDENYNPKGIRIGFLDDVSGWTSAQWCNNIESYNTRTSDEDDDAFKLSLAIEQEPILWMYYPELPTPYQPEGRESHG